MRFIDLFCGIGAFHISGKKQGWECALACDIDKTAINVYQNNHNFEVTNDIVKVTKFPRHDVLFAGFPCQPFSKVGRLEGFTSEKGQLFFHILRALQQSMPSIFVLENVPNILSHDNKNTFKVILSELTNLGYNIDYKILNSVGFTAQNRKRVFIVGCLHKQLFLPSLHNKPKVFLDIKDFGEHLANYITPQHTTNLLLSRNRFKATIQRDDIHVRCITRHYGQDQSECYIPFSDGVFRSLSHTECKRLFGLPDSFYLPTAKTSMYKLVGNSISVPVIDSILEYIKPQL